MALESDALSDKLPQMRMRLQELEKVQEEEWRETRTQPLWKGTKRQKNKGWMG